MTALGQLGILCVFLLQRSIAVDKVVYSSCKELASQPFKISVPEADTQAIIDKNQATYRGRICSTVENIRLSRADDTGSEEYAEYFSIQGQISSNDSVVDWFVYMMKPIDRESGINDLQVPIICTYKTSKTQFSLGIKITDVNDNFPVFNSRAFSFTVPEDISAGTTVFEVAATDRDSGVNQVIDYTLQQSSVAKSQIRCQFSIPTPQLGVVQVAGSLYGAGDIRCDFIIVATDGGTPPRSSTAQLTINIKDVDNQGPAFVYPGCVQDTHGYCIHAAYTATVIASRTGALRVDTVPSGTSDTGIQARDVDTSSALTFSIENDDGYEDYFRISTTSSAELLYTGEITLLIPLDESKANNFILYLQVQEVDKPEVNETALVYVRVLQASEETTDPPCYSTTIGENTLNSQASPNIAAIALGCVVILLVIIIVVLVIHIWRHKRKPEQEEAYSHLSANRTASQTYRAITHNNNNTPPRQDDKEGMTNQAASIYELERKPENQVKETPSVEYELPDGEYIEVIG